MQPVNATANRDQMLKNIQVRELKPDNIEAVSLLFNKVLAQLPYYNNAARSELILSYSRRGLADRMSQKSKQTLVAYDDNKVVGFCFYEEDSRTLWLDWIGVDVDYRHRGIAGILLDELERIAIKGKYFSIWCDTVEGNQRAANFFQRRGYGPIGLAKRHWFGLNFMLWNKPIEV